MPNPTGQPESPHEMTQAEIDSLEAVPNPPGWIKTGTATINGKSYETGYTPIMRLLNPKLFGDKEGPTQ